MITNTYVISGMTCAHCVRAVTAEVSALPQVTAVAVDLPTGTLTITSTTALDLDQVRTAIEEAGYELTGDLAGDPVR
jgi:copper chaperone CopZ